MAINDKIDEKLIIDTISKSLESFYSRLIGKIDGLKLDDLLKRKNPYLFYSKSLNTASEIIDGILSATISSSEETIFGNEFFEPLAIVASGGTKSLSEGADVEIITEYSIYLIAVKSGVSVFNSSSKKRQEENFRSAAKRAQQARKSFHPIIGYGYGKKNSNKKGDTYIELAGQEFWEELTGDSEFYKKIITYIGNIPEKHRFDFEKAYTNAKNRLELEFLNKYCLPDGSINWDLLVEYNSGR